MAIGKRIRHYRLKLGWKLKVLSQLADVDVGTFSALESRNSKRTEYAQQIAHAFGLTIEQLTDETRDWPVVDPRTIPAQASYLACEKRADYDPWMQNVNKELQKVHPAYRAEILAYLQWQVARAPPAGDGDNHSVAG